MIRAPPSLLPPSSPRPAGKSLPPDRPGLMETHGDGSSSAATDVCPHSSQLRSWSLSASARTSDPADRMRQRVLYNGPQLYLRCAPREPPSPRNSPAGIGPALRWWLLGSNRVRWTRERAFPPQSLPGIRFLQPARLARLPLTGRWLAASSFPFHPGQTLCPLDVPPGGLCRAGTGACRSLAVDPG